MPRADALIGSGAELTFHVKHGRPFGAEAGQRLRELSTGFHRGYS